MRLADGRVLGIAENGFAHLRAASAGRGRVKRPTSARDWREKSTPVGGGTATEAADAVEEGRWFRCFS